MLIHTNLLLPWYTRTHTYILDWDIHELLNSHKDFQNEPGCLRGVMAKAIDYGIVVSEFVLQSRTYVHFRANTLGKGINPFILPAMG